MIVTEHDEGGVWVARGLVRVRVREGRVIEVDEYQHCPWVLAAAGEIREAMRP